jgi:purine-binding chemotaxis protein CheW
LSPKTATLFLVTTSTDRELVGEIHALEEKLARLRRELLQNPAGTQAATVDLLTFRLADKSYALFLTDVIEVLRMVKLLPLPKSPPDVQGVINCRGTMIPVLNPGSLLSLQAVTPQLASNLIVVFSSGQQVALIVDAVEGVRSVSGGDLKLDSASQSLHRTMPRHFAGYTHSEAGNMFILDVEQLLDLEDRRALGLALRVRDEWGQG